MHATPYFRHVCDGAFYSATQLEAAAVYGSPCTAATGGHGCDGESWDDPVYKVPALCCAVLLQPHCMQSTALLT
jgi:hypothetical protein